MIEGIPDIDSPNFCPELWQRMFVLQLNDEFYVKPCCYASPSKNNQVLVADGDEIFKTYNQHPSIQQIREDNKQGLLDSGCEVCVHSEKLSGSSGRTRAIDQIKSTRSGMRAVKLSTQVDLNLGNLCNLACAICDPHSSTSWVPLHKKMYGRNKHGTVKFKAADRPLIDDPEWFKNIQILQLQGGEVFLQSAYTDYFRNIKRYRNLNGIEVRIFTNGTVMPDPELFELLSECRSVSLFFSIDDISKRFEYQRHGGKWSDVVDNLQWFSDNCTSKFTLGFHPTYSLLNVYYLDELYKFCSTKFPNFQRSYGPYHIGTGPCSTHALPKHIRQAILDKHTDIPELSFLNSTIVEDKNYDSTEFIDYINKYDSAIDNSYAATHPEFWKILTK